MVKRNKFMIKFILSLVIILSFSCGVPERYVTTLSQEQQKESEFQYLNTLDKTDESGIKFKGGDGSSMENAIIIYGVKNEIEAIPAEINYISKRHGERDKSWKMIMQSNFKINDRIYVEYQIEDYKKGIKTSYVFDNTSFYSAFMEKTGTPVTPQQEQKDDTRPAYQPALEITESSGIRYKGGDGSSMAKAIVIAGANNEEEIIKAQIDYISRRHGVKDRSWKIIIQSDFRKNDNPYVEYKIEDFKRGVKTAYFFDKTSPRSVFTENAAAPAAPQQEQKDTRPVYQPAAEKTVNSGIRYKGGDGSSMENAIIIFGAKNEKEVIQAEIDYISRRHGEKDKLWEIMFKSNFRKNYRHYNEINIKDFTSDGRFSYCFDATEAYDK
jgi:predicted GNAT superfamily acetyltransferase